MDLLALLAEKKKKASENSKSFQKPKSTPGNNNQRQMPMRKSGRGK